MDQEKRNRQTDDRQRQHLLMDCCRAQEVWDILEGLGAQFD